MTDERSTGIILRTRPLTETSLIVHWITRDVGRLATVAKGARRPKSPFRGKLDLLYVADFSFARSRRSDLHLLREVAVRDFNALLRHNIGYLEQAAQFTRLIERTTETETPIPELFDLLDAALRHLPSRLPNPLTLCAFKIKLLDHLGLRPSITDAPLSSSDKQLAEQLLAMPFDSLPSDSPSSSLNSVQRFLDQCIGEHI